MKNKHKKPKKKIEVFRNINEVRCPICQGEINHKWFNFRSGNAVEFIAECWSGDINLDPQPPSHIFYFQIAVPAGILVYGKGSKVFIDD